MSQRGERPSTSNGDVLLGCAPPGFARRLAALSYDLFLLLGVLMAAVALVVVPYDLVAGRPFPHEQDLFRGLLQLYLSAVFCTFYGYFWVRAGQTLGMRAWGLSLVREDGSKLTPRDAILRLTWAAVCLAPAGLGLLWMLFDRHRLTCYDRLSRTRLVSSRPPRQTGPARPA